VPKATFTVGVFGLACWNDNGTLRIKVNERTDQKRQKELAGLPNDSTAKIIDMPGGGVELEDFSQSKKETLLDILRRVVDEETGGCTFSSSGEFSQPFMVVTNNQDNSLVTGDIAFWMPICLIGKPKPTNEAQNHPWITFSQLNEEDEYRAVAALDDEESRQGQHNMYADDPSIARMSRRV